jgi:hypothetical protein
MCIFRVKITASASAKMRIHHESNLVDVYFPSQNYRQR